MKKILLALAMIATMTANAQSTWHNTDNQQYNNNYGTYNGYGQGYYIDERDYMNPHKSDYIRHAENKEVNLIINLLKKLSFDDQRLEAAKVCITLRPMMAEDIRKMAKTFSFDDSRMKFLEFAFAYCVDREMYHIMNDVFSFRSNADKCFKNLKYNRNNRYGHYDNGHGNNNGHLDNGHGNGHGNSYGR